MSLSNSENNKKAIICPKCKQELPKDSQFCHFCGANIKTAILSQMENIPQETISEPSPVIHTLNHTETVKRSKNKPIIIGIVSAVAVALIAVLIILLVENNGKDTDIYNVGVRTISFEDKFTAEYVLATWENGAKTEKSMIAIMDEYGSEQGGGQLYIITHGQFVEEVEEWCFSPKRRVGDCAIIKNAYGYSICYISNINLEADYYIDATYNNSSDNSFPSSESNAPTTEPQQKPPSTTNNETTSKPQATKPSQLKPETTKPQQPTTINCLRLTCDNVVSKSGQYCSEHKCANSNCSFAKDYDSQYCSVCRCSNIKCKNMKISTGSYCIEHTCEVSGCTSKKRYSSDYCITHKCNSCDNIKIDNGSYCVEHTCEVSGCTSKKQYSSDYCITHKCNSCDNIIIDNGSYCVDHTCSETGCTSSKQYGSEYCMSHTCLAGLCKDLRVDGGLYCKEHTCEKNGCYKQKLLPESDYCYSHTP